MWGGTYPYWRIQSGMSCTGKWRTEIVQLKNGREQSREGNSRHSAKQVSKSGLLLRVERPQVCKMWRTPSDLLPGFNTFKFVVIFEPWLPVFFRPSQKGGGKSHLTIVNLMKMSSEKMKICRKRKEYLSFTFNSCWKPSICRLKFRSEMLLFSSVSSFWTSLSPSGQVFSPREDWC